jgi:hypothetical protein
LVILGFVWSDLVWLGKIWPGREENRHWPQEDIGAPRLCRKFEPMERVARLGSARSVSLGPSKVGILSQPTGPDKVSGENPLAEHSMNG